MSQIPPPPLPPSNFVPHRGSLILALGIIGLVVCQPVGIFAWLMGNTDLRQIRSGRMDPEGEGLTNAGRILGIVATVLLLLQLAILAVVLVFMVGMAAIGHR